MVVKALNERERLFERRDSAAIYRGGEEHLRSRHR
jgi:hypothetical protein